jgi:hypothetical protein
MPLIPNATVKPGYRSQSDDTSLEADIFQFSRLRQWTSEKRLALTAQLIRHAKALCLAGIKTRHPDAALMELRSRFAQAVLGDKYPAGFAPIGGNEQVWVQDSIALVGQLDTILSSLNIAYYVGGGIASTIHGEPRTTRDLDLIIQVQAEIFEQLVAALEAIGFYCPPGAVEEILRGSGKVLSITHMETLANADLAIMGNSAFERSQLARKFRFQFEGTEFWLCSAKDIILQKLVWGRRSQSEKQWRDVLGVLKVQVETLDYGYLAEWAAELGVLEALNQAMVEAGV